VSAAVRDRKFTLVCVLAVLLGAGAVILALCLRPALNEPEKYRLEQLVLLDVQGLWGGQNLYVWGDGAVVVQMVGDGCHQERRYRLNWDEARIRELEDLLRRHNFFRLHLAKPRLMLPDGGYPQLRVRLASGEEHATAKLANDKHRDFDAIYEWLLERVKEAEAGQPEYVGEFDWKYTPSREKDKPDDATSRE
jgi:hypothetical protein